MRSTRSTTRRALASLVCATSVCAIGLSGCTVVRVYVGSQFRNDPATIIRGVTTVAEILERFGAPDRIQRQSNGDVFIYRYMRRDERTFTFEEPVVTNTEIFSYTEIREDTDRLVVVFDRDGVVSAYGIRTGASDLDAGG